MQGNLILFIIFQYNYLKSHILYSFKKQENAINNIKITSVELHKLLTLKGKKNRQLYCFTLISLLMLFMSALNYQFNVFLSIKSDVYSVSY
jgi:hypothetical protein